MKRRPRREGAGGHIQADRLLASSIRARAPWRRSRCSWRRRLAAPPAWLPFSSSTAAASSSSSDWRNSMGSCCSWSSSLALFGGLVLVVVGARCSRVCQYLRRYGTDVSNSTMLWKMGELELVLFFKGGLCVYWLCQPLRHSLVVNGLRFALALLWFFPLEPWERVAGTVTVSMREPVATSCPQKDGKHC